MLRVLWALILSFGTPIFAQVSADPCQIITEKSCGSEGPHFPDGTGAITPLNFRERTTEIIPSVKAALIQWISDNVRDPQHQEKMKARISSINVNIQVDCTDMSYNPEHHRVSFCFGFMKKNPSEYALVQALAHEMAHSIDPCSLKTPVGLNPPVVSSSVLPYSTIECLISDDAIGFGRLASKKSNLPEPAVRPDICDGLRPKEGFCDYIASEVLASLLRTRWSEYNQEQKINGLSNIFGRHCSAKDIANVGPFRTPINSRSRTEWILLSNQRIRRALGCNPSQGPKKYCGKESPGSSPESNFPSTEYNFSPSGAH